MKVRVEFDLSASDLAAIQRHYRLSVPARGTAARAFLHRFGTDAIAAARSLTDAKCRFEDCENDATTGRTFPAAGDSSFALPMCEGCWQREFGARAVAR